MTTPDALTRLAAAREPIHFVSGGRQQGKTTAMIREASEHFAYIVCPDRRQAEYVFRMAQGMGVDIPFPITWGDFVANRYNPAGVRGFVIDNLDQCLQSMTRVPIVGASLPAVEVLSRPTVEGSPS